MEASRSFYSLAGGWGGKREKVEWNNSRLISENIKEEILNIKQQPGKDLVRLGGADIASNLLQLGLIDEYRIILTPVVLSNGKPFIKNIKDKLTLSLLKTRTFISSIDY